MDPLKRPFVKIALLAILACTAVGVAIYAFVVVFGDAPPKEEVVSPPWIKPHAP